MANTTSFEAKARDKRGKANELRSKSDLLRRKRELLRTKSEFLNCASDSVDKWIESTEGRIDLTWLLIQVTFGEIKLASVLISRSKSKRALHLPKNATTRRGFAPPHVALLAQPAEFARLRAAAGQGSMPSPSVKWKHAPPPTLPSAQTRPP